MGRIPALDGLRTIAIAIVVAYHVDNTIFQAGHWGVPMFFVLSGFVITGAVYAEVDRTGQLALGTFYRKRLLRLYPAVLVVCAAMLVIGTDWSMVQPTLGSYANYARTEGIGLGRLTHTWFLSVIVHFYLLWPLAIRSIPARHRVKAIGAMAIVALVWRAIAIEIMSPGWVYNATDTNAAALLVGAWLAVARPKRIPLAGLSVPALLGLMFLPVFGNTGDLIFWGGFIAIALSAIAVVYATTNPTWLEHTVLLKIAEVSFGIYLWHYVFVRSDIPLWSAAVLTVIATMLSWRLVEQPVLRWDAARRARAAASVEPTPTPSRSA
ncbi:MAG: acyltransferase [Actinomycetota bacterium]